MLNLAARGFCYLLLSSSLITGTLPLKSQISSFNLYHFESATACTKEAERYFCSFNSYSVSHHYRAGITVDWKIDRHWQIDQKICCPLFRHTMWLYCLTWLTSWVTV